MNAKAFAIIIMAVLAVSLTGCTTTQQGTATGAVAGGALGAVVGNNLGSGSGDREKGALLGAAAGALLGNQIGQQKQRNQQLEQRLNTVEQQGQQQTVWIENSNSSKTPVILRRAPGGMWVGPRGEYYSTMPSQEQLKKIYGF
jgi:outer membrane lipoprotein SlyB